MRLLKVSAIGCPYIQTPEGNDKFILSKICSHLKEQIEQVLPDKPDIIVLPEHADLPCGLSDDKITKYAVATENIRLSFMSEIAQGNSCHLAYNSIVCREDQLRNATMILGRNGEILGEYYKNYPTIYEMENGIVPGNETPLITTDFGTLGCLICFDLNFPDLRKKYKSQSPDLLIFSSMYHGGLMQKVWAYDVQAHFVGAIARNESTILTPSGEMLASNSNYFPYVTTNINLDCGLYHIDYNNTKFVEIKKIYGRAISISCPSYLGSVCIFSEDKSISIKDIEKKFKLEPLDEYLSRSRYHKELKTQSSTKFT